tara:strand:+ start:391 stop:558 length:168 start_codon:yes stop_codon:yes gene_type:complete
MQVVEERRVVAQRGVRVIVGITSNVKEFVVTLPKFGQIISRTIYLTIAVNDKLNE